MGLSLEHATDARTICSKLCRLIYTKAAILRLDQIVNDFLLAEQFCLNLLHSSAQLHVLSLQVVGGDALLHHIIVKTFPLLMDDFRA